MKTDSKAEIETIIIDTYAWVEYFRGGNEGKRAGQTIDGDFKLVTPAFVIAELSDKYRRSGATEEWENEKFVFIGIKSEITQLDADTADLAGKIKTEKRRTHPDFGLGDALVLATAKKMGAKLLTGDRHLKNEKNAIDITKQ